MKEKYLVKVVITKLMEFETSMNLEDIEDYATNEAELVLECEKDIDIEVYDNEGKRIK